MANTKSAEKRNRQAQKRRARNTTVRTTVKVAVKKAREALTTKDAGKTTDAVKEATRTLAKAASKGVIHPRNAARRIARLAKAANAGKAK
ncbi:30S ribosomal protein S20 [Hyalangium rubrum]|uniref:Small ribosomal subunit protein bS20 n=1 Tax=Hyalangium rubrum TaxID=3103134 RepID=A0ABU5H8Z4_9BACT|nr:30S ribosomal protein S20 [Hyalangium sp. s54d21]MDY7229954.1 30S ribosomal protein S20 [Hyalangium sp. s54d21]